MYCQWDLVYLGAEYPPVSSVGYSDTISARENEWCTISLESEQEPSYLLDLVAEYHGNYGSLRNGRY